MSNNDFFMSVMNIFVGGKEFIVFREDIKKYPDTFPAKLKGNEYFFDDRDPDVFVKVLEFYQTGTLGRNQRVTNDKWYKNLDLWGIPYTREKEELPYAVKSPPKEPEPVYVDSFCTIL